MAQTARTRLEKKKQVFGNPTKPHFSKDTAANRRKAAGKCRLFIKPKGG
jgi:hypothetical protein